MIQPGVEQLKVYDGTNWVPGNLKKQLLNPSGTKSQQEILG